MRFWRATFAIDGLWPVRWTHGCNGRKRQKVAREGTCASGECAGGPRHDSIRLALSLFQKDSALARGYRARTADGHNSFRKTMIVALARKLLIALWRLVMTGEMPEGVSLRPAM